MENLIGILNSNENENVKLFCNKNLSYNSQLYNLFDGEVGLWTGNTLDEKGLFIWDDVVRTPPFLIGVQFKKSRTIVQQYSITARNRNEWLAYPTHWTFEGSNDSTTGIDGNWTVLDTQTGIKFETKEKKIFSFNNNTSFNYYRINITQPNYIFIGELELFGEPSQKYLIQDKSNILYTLEGGEYTDNLIPKMTNNTSPSGKADGSGYTSRKNFFYSFDGNTNTNWINNQDVYTKVGWISYKFDTSKRICKYTLVCKDTFAPKTWTFEGSNDGVNWTVLDTRTNQPVWQGEKREYIFNNDMLFFYYKINIISNQGHDTGVGIYEMEMMSKISSIMKQIEGNLDEDNFVKNGFSDPTVITKNLLINKFGSLEGIKLLAYTDDLEKQECNMVYNCEPYRPIDKLDDEFDIVMLQDKEQ